MSRGLLYSLKSYRHLHSRASCLSLMLPSSDALGILLQLVRLGYFSFSFVAMNEEVKEDVADCGGSRCPDKSLTTGMVVPAAAAAAVPAVSEDGYCRRVFLLLLLVFLVHLILLFLLLLLRG